MLDQFMYLYIAEENLRIRLHVRKYIGVRHKQFAHALPMIFQDSMQFMPNARAKCHIRKYAPKYFQFTNYRNCPEKMYRNMDLLNE